MALLNRIFNTITLNTNVYHNSNRFFSLYPRLQLKQITEKQEGNTIVIQGNYVPSSREQFLVKTIDHNACPLCKTGLDVKHTDVLILSQFVRSDGCMLPKRITGLCNKQQRKVSTMVAMAQKAGLMSNLTPATSKKDPKLRKKWKKFNTYFDESTINVK